MLSRRLLQQLIEDSRRRRDAAAAASAQAVRTTRQAEQTLDTLRDYRRDYDRKAPKMRTQALDPRLLPQHEQFVQRLDVAVTDQVGQVQRLQQEADARRGRLVDSERRLKAFETLRARQSTARALRLQRLEQFETDELASRLARKQRSNGDST